MSEFTVKKPGLLSHIPTGTAALFFIQIFSTLAFAVLYSTLVLYMTHALNVPIGQANLIMGAFLAFNYGLHFLGGYFGGRLLSFRFLFVVGVTLQMSACIILSFHSLFMLYFGLGCFLTGSGLNVTCMNMMVTQLFKPEDKRREAAFLWNYSGMNVGFFVGFAMAGYYQLSYNYHSLFLLSSLSGFITLALMAINWRKLYDRTTPLSEKPATSQLRNTIIGLGVIALMVPLITYLVKNATVSGILVIVAVAAMLCLMFYLSTRQKEKDARNRMRAYVMLTLSAMVFWTMYQLAPMGLTIFAKYNVDRHFLGYIISPQWILNINTIVIAFGGPLCAFLFRYIRSKGFTFSVPRQFALSLAFVGVGFVILPIGIYYANAHGLSNFSWIFWSYVLQSIAELLISPVGYAMIGQLAPSHLQGLMMGTWMMMTGAAGALAGYLSDFAISHTHTTDPIVTNTGYSHLFGALGILALGVSVVLFFLVPFLRRLINEKPLQASGATS